MKKPQKSVVFFIDRCLECNSIVEGFRNAGITIEVHKDHFPEDAEDVNWLPTVGEKGWVVLTKDSMIANNPMERMAVARCGVKMFTLYSAKLLGTEMVKIFLDAIVKMQYFSISQPAPFIAKVNRKGKIALLYSKQDLEKEMNYE